MPSARVLALSTIAAALVGIPTYFAVAQPSGEPAPAPRTAPAGQPDAQPGNPGGPEGPGGRGQPGEGRRRGPGGGAPETVKGGMSMMNRNLRTLKRQIADASKKDENLKLIGDVERGCVIAKNATPARQLDAIEDKAKREELAMNYRRHLLNVLSKLVKLETAVMDGKSEEAGAELEEIVKLRDEGHELMGVDDR